MQEVSRHQCEWAVNNAGAVMLSMPVFYKDSLEYAFLNGKHLIIKYDWFYRIKVLIPEPVIPFILAVPTILLVAFTATGNIFEIDLQIRNDESS